MILNLYITDEKELVEDIQQDLILRAQTTNILDCFFFDEDDLPVDITGDELYFMVKATPSTADASAVVNKKVTLFTSPTGGEAQVELTATDTASLLGNYVYQMKIKHGGKWYTVAEGNVCFGKSMITRES